MSSDKAAFWAELDAMFESPPAKPKAVVAEGQIVREADVTVSGADANAEGGKPREVQVRRPEPSWRVGANDDGYWTMTEHGRQWIRNRERWRRNAYGYYELATEDEDEGNVVSRYNPLSNENIWRR
jgi:hypothetical protein